uniref:Uncharacterized protein n=1 Tax=Glossina palpalis gambiensis TaxID=67801 RepID=A0A1B0C7R8_9MUSC
MNKLWEQLAQKLNARGPPIKDASLIKSTLLKKKLSCNKVSKLQTRGRDVVKIPLTFAEKQIIDATGLEISATGADRCSFSTISSIGLTGDMTDKTIHPHEREGIPD